MLVVGAQLGHHRSICALLRVIVVSEINLTGAILVEVWYLIRFVALALLSGFFVTSWCITYGSEYRFETVLG